MMARMKSWIESDTPLPKKSDIMSAIENLTAAKSTFDRESVEQKKCKFLIEQVKLLRVNEYRRSYSPD